MKMISQLALGVALATGAAGLALAPPAFAKDKKEEKAAGLKLSPAFLKVAKPAQDAVNAGDPAVSEPLVAQAEAAATTDDDRYVAAQARYVVESQKINAAAKANPNAPLDQNSLAKPLDALIANPRTPPEDRAKYYYSRAQLAYASKQYPVAIDYFTKARELGNTNPELSLFLVRAKNDAGDMAGASAELNQAVAAKTAKGEKAPVEWYKFGIAQSNKRKLKPQTMEWLVKYAAAYPAPQTWYEVLATYGLQQDSVAKLDNKQKIDLFRLMRATGGLADQYFYLEYAQKAASAGLPAEALAVLKEGLANGKIPASNTEAKAMLTETATAMRAEGSLPSLEAKAKANASGALAMQTGDAYLGNDNYAKAVELYRLAMTKGGVDADTVNTRMGIALARAGDKAGAATAFAAVKGEPRVDIAQFWTTYVNLAPAA